MRERLSKADEARFGEKNERVHLDNARKYIKAAMRELLEYNDERGELARVKREIYNIEDILWQFTTTE